MTTASAPTFESCPPVGVRFHEYANLFPMMEGQAWRDFVADVRDNGIREPVVFLGEFILDGRNRYMAARECGIDYPRAEYDGDDPLGFVISTNLKRRHLSDSQRAMVAAKLAKISHGGTRQPGKPAEGLSQARAAEILNVGERSVARAKVVEQEGAPELVEAVQSGKASVAAAAEIATLPKPEQVAVSALTDREILARAKVIRDARQAEKKERRGEREEDLSKRIHALPERCFGVIYADPEWRFEPWSRETGMDRAADNHYPTSDLETIKARDVRAIAADDCVLFLWATAPMLPQALDVMAAWGFAYKTHMIWHKQRPGEARGTGYWFTGEHELLLLGTRGKVPAPAPGTQYPSTIAAPVGEHSAKPDVFAEMIEAYFPNLPKIELNRRGAAREGWESWGNEAL